jgi:hypothetical protein
MFMVLILTAWNAIRLGASIANWDLLKEFAPRPGPIYIAASASFWTFYGLALWMALRRRNPRSKSASAIFMLGYAAWWWADRLLLQTPSPNWPFALALTIFLLMLTAFNIFNRKTTEYLRQRETYEQTPTDSNSA